MDVEFKRLSIVPANEMVAVDKTSISKIAMIFFIFFIPFRIARYVPTGFFPFQLNKRHGNEKVTQWKCRNFSCRYFLIQKPFISVEQQQVDGHRDLPLQWMERSRIRPGGVSMPSEWELLEKAKAGDRDALGEIVAECWQPLYRFISYKTGNLEEAQDLVQETFFRAFRSLASYQKTDARFSTWLGRIATNLITDEWRKKGRTPLNSELGERQNELTGGEDPFDILVNQETKEMLAALLTKLPDEQRRVIELRILAGLPVKDTSIAMNKSEAAVKMLQQRALKNLREMMADRGVWGRS